MLRPRLISSILAILLACAISKAYAATSIRIMPPDRGVLAAGQLVDIRVEATSDDGVPPRALRVSINGVDVTGRNDPASDRGAPPNSRNFLLRGFSATPGPLRISARTADGGAAEVALTVEPWQGRAAGPRAQNIIFLLGDGMGAAHRTAARIVSRGVRDGKALGRLAMDTLDVTGMVMTSSLNAVITDSSPGMAAYSTGQKNNNNQEGVFPDNTADAFDNPRIEYIGELLRRTRGPGFNVGMVTTADVTDSTPGANAAHTSDRYAGAGIAAQFFDERSRNGIAVLLGGGARHFLPTDAGGARPDNRRLRDEFERAGYVRVSTGREVQALLAAASPPQRVLGLFHQSHMVVAFDKVGAGTYSDELAQPRNEAYRDTPMLEDLARLAIRSLAAHSPDGFYLLIEGASIDKRAHAADAERTIWDTIEFDRAVQVALDFAKTTNGDQDPSNDTLVIVTGDHETGAMGVIGVGNERYAPRVLGKAVRDYAAVFRFEADQRLGFYTNYTVDDRGFPTDPDPTKKLLIGWGSSPDRYDNWLADRLQTEAAVVEKNVAVANRARDAGEAIPGRFIEGTIENGATGCPGACFADTAADPHTITGHTASDVPLSAAGPGAWQFTGVYENTDVFLKMLRSSTGTYRRDSDTR